MNHTEEGYAIYHDLLISAGPAKIFEVVSEPEHLVQWWPLRCSGRPVAGETYHFHFGSDYDWYGKVVVAKVPQSFVEKMTKSDPDWNPTTLTFELEAEKEGTRLQFRHTGWPACNAHYRHSSFCWALLLKALKDYVEKGVVVPY